MANTTEQPVPTAEQVILMTPTAISEVKRLLAEENEPSLFLRLGISSGGCSGMSYTMSFDNEASQFDREFDFDGVKVRVELKALVYLAGTTVDYKKELMGGGFAFHNPNAKRSCGCGSSFTC